MLYSYLQCSSVVLRLMASVWQYGLYSKFSSSQVWEVPCWCWSLFLALGSTWGHFYMFASTLLHLAVSLPVCKFMLHLILLYTVPFTYVRCSFPFCFVTQLQACSSLREHRSTMGSAVAGWVAFLTPSCLCSSAPRLHFSKPLLSYQACISLCVPLH